MLRARDTLIADQGGLRAADRRDLCAAFQSAVADVLAERSRRALALVAGAGAGSVAGAIAANGEIRAALEQVAARAGARFLAPPLRLCTDNGAMIAWAGIERFRMGQRDDMTLSARPRWPLDQGAAPVAGQRQAGGQSMIRYWARAPSARRWPWR